MWKHANVMPLFKKGDSSKWNNYRPVSLLSCTSKILERIVFKRVFNYLRDNNILTSHQSGFQPGDSTVNQLAYYIMFLAMPLIERKMLELFSVIFRKLSTGFGMKDCYLN